MKVFASLTGILLFSILLTGCTPDVGTPAWCEYMNNKPKGDWSTNEATDYAKHCLFK